MRQGFTQINNNIFDLVIKPNEKLLLIYLLSHDEKFEITIYRIEKDLGFKFETIKKISLSLLDFLKNQGNIEFSIIIKRLEKIITPKIDISKNGYIQKRSQATPKLDTYNSKIGVLTTPKLEYKNIKENIKENNIKNIVTVKKDNSIEKFKNDLFFKKDELIKLAGSRENLKIHYDFFMDYLENKKGSYKNPLAAFRNAIRGNWAKVARASPQQMSFKVQDELLRQKKEADFDEKIQEIVKKRKEQENDKVNHIFFKRDGL